MMERFLKNMQLTSKYSHQMQSLDYQVIDKILDYDQDIPAFILPVPFPSNQGIWLYHGIFDLDRKLCPMAMEFR